MKVRNLLPLARLVIATEGKSQSNARLPAVVSASLVTSFFQLYVALMASQRIASIPALTYGTAFKFDDSAALTASALRAGFRGIDTAGSASAYREALVGEGITTFLANCEVTRKDLYVKPLKSDWSLLAAKASFSWAIMVETNVTRDSNQVFSV